MRPAVLLLALLLLPLAAASPLLAPQQGDPDVAPTGTLVASIQVFRDEKFHFTEGHRTKTLTVPQGWDRALVVYESRQVREPWDRRFGVAIDDVEVLRGTTPRVAFGVTKDVTQYGALLTPGAEVPIALHLGSWIADGWILASVRFEFYADDAAAPVEVFDEARSAARWAYMSGGSFAGSDLMFPETAPARAVLEVTTSGHGQEGEFWYLETPPAVASFRIVVDGTEVGHLTAMPYVYALVGLGGGSVVLDTVHTGVWWSAFRAADVAGIHAGVGEIPAYRAEVDASQLALFTGARRVEVVQDTGAGTWVTSLTILTRA